MTLLEDLVEAARDTERLRCLNVVWREMCRQEVAWRFDVVSLLEQLARAMDDPEGAADDADSRVAVRGDRRV